MTLNEARRLTGLTQVALAEAAGCAPGDIVDLERGRNRRPAYELVMGIVRAFREHGMPGLIPEDLFPLNDEEQVTR